MGRPDSRFTIEQVLSPAFPYGIVGARTTDRIAWIENERGMRNVYTASAPSFTPVRLTATTEDDGVDLRPLDISADGSVVVFIRGHAPGVGGESDTPGWIANPSGDPEGGKNEVWAASTTVDRHPWRVVEARNFVLSPDGRWIAYVKDGQVHRAAVDPGVVGTTQDNAPPLFKDFGVSGNPVWSPDSRKIAYVSGRKDHAFIGVYDVMSRRITYMSPSVDNDSAPVWSPDGKRIAFLRRPGAPYGVTYQRPRNLAPGALPAGFVDAKFRGGYTLGIWVADGETGTASELWHNAPGETAFAAMTRMYWAGDQIVFDAGRKLAQALLGSATGKPNWFCSRPVKAKWNTLHSRAMDVGCTTPRTSLISDGAILASSCCGGQHNSSRRPRPDTFPVAQFRRASCRHACRVEAAFVRCLGCNRGTRGLRTWRSFLRTARRRRPMVTAADGIKSYAQIFLPRSAPGENGHASFIHGGSRQQTLLGYHHQQPHGSTTSPTRCVSTSPTAHRDVGELSPGIGMVVRFMRHQRFAAGLNTATSSRPVVSERPFDVDPQRVGVGPLMEVF